MHQKARYSEHVNSIVEDFYEKDGCAGVEKALDEIRAELLKQNSRDLGALAQRLGVIKKQ